MEYTNLMVISMSYISVPRGYWNEGGENSREGVNKSNQNDYGLYNRFLSPNLKNVIFFYFPQTCIICPMLCQV